MTPTDLDDTEALLSRQLNRLASYAPRLPTRGLTEPPVATPQPTRPRSVPKWAIAAGIAVVVSAGVTVATISVGIEHGPSIRSGSNLAPIVHQLTIRASNFHFQASNFDVPAGITRITLVSVEGSHTLVFADPELAYVKLAAPSGRRSVRVELHAGRVYTVFCALPGHRAAGMEATITVAPGSDQAK